MYKETMKDIHTTYRKNSNATNIWSFYQRTITETKVIFLSVPYPSAQLMDYLCKYFKNYAYPR